MVKKIHFSVFILLSFLLLSGINEYYSDITGEGESLTVVILLLSLILYVCQQFYGFNFSLVPVKPIAKVYFFAVLFFIVWGSLVAVINGQKDDAVWGIRYYGPALLTFVILYHSLLNLKIQGKLEEVTILTRNILLINAILAATEFVSGGGLGLVNEENRYSGLLSNANDAAFLFNILLILCHHIYRFNRDIFSVVGIFVSTLAVIGTFSKTGIIIMAIIWINTVIRNVTFGNKFTRLFYVCLIVAFVIYLPKFLGSGFLDEFQFERISEISQLLNGEIDEKVTTKRTSIFDVALIKMDDNWFFGQGSRTFSYIDSLGVGVHNIYLLLLGETGLISLILYIFFLFKLGNNDIKRENYPPYLNTVRLIVITIVVYGFTNHNIFFSKFIVLIIAFTIVIKSGTQSSKMQGQTLKK